VAPHLSSPTDPDVAPHKAALRAAALQRRDALHPEWRADASEKIAERVLALPELAGLSPVAGFWPIRSEVDPRALMEALHGRGVTLALPVVADPHLLFRLWKPGDALVQRPFGLSEPPGVAPEVLPRALLVPLACFDRSGGRIGYGKGLYDRTLAALKARSPVLAVGLAFSVQAVAQAPVTERDEPLDMVVTEAEVIRTPHARV
jgi:5-formyltetrahydrofolate cyclo-ligase